MRLFRFRVLNGFGDEAYVEFTIPDDVPPDAYRLKAIGRARRMLADIRPWSVVGMEELAIPPDGA